MEVIDENDEIDDHTALLDVRIFVPLLLKKDPIKQHKIQSKLLLAVDGVCLLLRWGYGMLLLLLVACITR